MAQLAPVFMAAGTVMSVAGQRQGARAAREIGQRRRVAAEFEAAQIEQASGQVIASAQRDAIEQERQSEMLQSRALALAAASGGGASDPTVQNLIAKTAANGAYRKSVALYQGEEKARQLRLAAVAKRTEGAIAEAGGETEGTTRDIGAFGTALQAGGSLYSKYGVGGSGFTEASLIAEQVPGQYSTTNRQYG